MDPDILELLRRGHAIFGTPAAPPAVRGDDGTEADRRLAGNANLHGGGGNTRYAEDLTQLRSAVRGSAATDTELRELLARLAAEHAEGHRRTKDILGAAHADTAPGSDTPIGRREAIARKAAYLRHQQQAIREAHGRANSTAAALRALHYRRHYRGHRISPEQLRHLPNTRGANALRHALTQLGVDYVWGGENPGKGLDCSGLTQYAWRAAGVHIPRTTFDQIHFGAAVPRGDVEPGDLVFPASAHGGHVQMYAGNGKVIEAPYSGAKVRITAMPHDIMAIRRPL